MVGVLHKLLHHELITAGGIERSLSCFFSLSFFWKINSNFSVIWLIILTFLELFERTKLLTFFLPKQRLVVANCIVVVHDVSFYSPLFLSQQ